MLQFFTRGEGPQAVLLLHGFLGSGRNLASFASRWAALNPALRIIVPDQLGHGTSPAMPEPPTVEALADAARELLVAEGASDAILVGHSLGGRVALLAAREDTPRIVMLDIAPGPIALTDGLDSVLASTLDAPKTAASRQEMRDFFLGRGVSAGLTEWALMNLVASPQGLRWRVDREALRRLNQETTTRDLWPQAERWASKLTCLRGEQSHFVSDADVAQLAAIGASALSIAAAGHFLHVDQPELLLARLEEAVAEKEFRAASLPRRD